MSEIKDIQYLINCKARERAKNEVNKLCEAFRANNHLHSLVDKINLVDKDGKKDSLRSAFWSVASDIPNMLVEQLTEIYIPEESGMFIRKVDELKQEVDTLMNNQQY